MKEEQTTAVAREYAEECIDPNGFSRGTYKELVEEKAERTASVLRWLSDRYCLVEKSKVERVMQLHEDKLKELFKGSKTWFFHKGSAETLKYIFPDLGKEVEE